ncbi:MAG: hypothetical protein COT18_06725 [Elusimicrobia bacterium CG08_land_8_20_14_0_20_59_10]|nr:MAG: hypothetical protein COT18_06725 [Elusimicrobia bacterium CG08_land_8_20_14_0_20_59_10]
MDDRLRSIRGKIDGLDRRIAGLLAKRFSLALRITREQLRKQPADHAREKRVLGNAAAAAGDKAFRAAARDVFAEVIRQTKKIQNADTHR